jgi:hypothetical protein
LAFQKKEKDSIQPIRIQPHQISYIRHSYGAKEIRICIPARVSIVGAEDEMYGFTLR